MKFGDTLYLETVRLAEGIKKPSLRLDIQKALLAAHAEVERLGADNQLAWSVANANSKAVDKLTETQAALDVATGALTTFGTYREGQVLKCGDERLYLIGRDARAALSQPAIAKRQKELDAMEKILDGMRTLRCGILADGTIVEGRIVEYAEEKIIELDAVRSEK